MLPILFTILLLEGFITISVEILTIRQLIPFFGNSVIITSIIIGFFLLFLALGYWRGGYEHDNFFKKLSRNFICAMLWIGVGLSYMFIFFFYTLTTVQWKLPYLISMTLYLCMILAPIVYWLGQTIPLTTNLFNQQLKISHISGRALFLSTLGSFLGALTTSLIFFQYFGVASAVVVNCLLLFLLIIQLRSKSNLYGLAGIALGILLFFIGFINMDYENFVFKLTNNYANYRISETIDHDKILEINLSNSSMLTQDQKAFPYIEFMRDILFQQLQLRHKKILVIGAGGFTLSAAGTFDNDFTYIDIDPAIKPLAEKHFLEKKISGQFIGQDARLYLNQTQQSFDVIVSDVYSHQTAIPAPMLTREYFHQLAAHLRPEGLLLVNIISNPLFKNPFSKRVYNTLHEVFPFCAVIPLSWKSHRSNVIYICPKQTADKTMYTDNLTRATFDYFD